MERRVSLVNLLIRRRRITKVEYEGVAVVSDAETLENTIILLVGNAELVSMLPLETHCLLVCR